MDPEVVLVLNKCAGALVVVISGAVGAVVPYIVNRRDKSARFIVLFEALAAGTLLGLAIFHLFLEAAHTLEEAEFGYSIGEVWHNPVQTFVFLGFLIVLIVEHIPGCTHDHGPMRDEPCAVCDDAVCDGAHAVAHEHCDCTASDADTTRGKPKTGFGEPLLHPVCTDKACLRDNSVVDIRADNHVADSAMVLVRTTHYTKGSEVGSVDDGVCNICTADSGCEHTKRVGKDDRPSLAASRPRFSSTHSSASVTTLARKDSHADGGCCTYNANARVVSSLVALGLHSLFEGMLIGLAATVSEAWIITLGVISHKWAEAFALSCQYIQAQMSRTSVIVHHAIFLGVQLLAVAIGIAIQSQNETAAGIFVSLACGTIIYVATSSLFHTMSKPVVSGMWQTRYMARLATFTLGGLLMGAASLIPLPH